MVRNTYGWNVMKPAAIDNEMWDEVYDVYVEDKFDLDLHQRMGDVNPAAMMEMTATMMETARKGMWKATPEQLARLAELHTEFVDKYGPSGGGFEGNNKKLQAFIKEKAPQSNATAYAKQMEQAEAKSAVVMEKQTQQMAGEAKTTALNGIVIALVAVVALIAVVALMRKKRKKEWNS